MTTRIRKNVSVAIVKVITHGIRRRSVRQLNKIAAPVKVLITQAQNSSEPGCPPHSAVILKKVGSDDCVVAQTDAMLKSPLTCAAIKAIQAIVNKGQVISAALRALRIQRSR